MRFYLLQDNPYYFLGVRLELVEWFAGAVAIVAASYGLIRLVILFVRWIVKKRRPKSSQMLRVQLEYSPYLMQRVRQWVLRAENHSSTTAYIRSVHVLTSAKKELPWDIDGYYYRRTGSVLPEIQKDKNNRHIAILPEIPLLLAIFAETSRNSETCEWFMARVIFEDGEELTTEKVDLIRLPAT
jgi:hypothetical protein